MVEPLRLQRRRRRRRGRRLLELAPCARLERLGVRGFRHKRPRVSGRLRFQDASLLRERLVARGERLGARCAGAGAGAGAAGGTSSRCFASRTRRLSSGVFRRAFPRRRTTADAARCPPPGSRRASPRAPPSSSPASDSRASPPSPTAPPPSSRNSFLEVCAQRLFAARRHGVSSPGRRESRRAIHIFLRGLSCAPSRTSAPRTSCTRAAFSSTRAFAASAAARPSSASARAASAAAAVSSASVARRSDASRRASIAAASANPARPRPAAADEPAHPLAAQPARRREPAGKAGGAERREPDARSRRRVRRARVAAPEPPSRARPRSGCRARAAEPRRRPRGAVSTTPLGVHMAAYRRPARGRVIEADFLARARRVHALRATRRGQRGRGLEAPRRVAWSEAPSGQIDRTRLRSDAEARPRRGGAARTAGDVGRRAGVNASRLRQLGHCGAEPSRAGPATATLRPANAPRRARGGAAPTPARAALRPRPARAPRPLLRARAPRARARPARHAGSRPPSGEDERRVRSLRGG